MKKIEIKQTQIYNFFSINKKTNASIRSIIDENKYTNNYLLKRNIGKKEKNESNITNNQNKNSNFKIKDFFSFKEYPEDIDDLQNDLKNMLIQSDHNINKTGIIKDISQKPKISSFTDFPEIKNSNSNNSNNNNSIGNNNLQINGLSNNNKNNNNNYSNYNLNLGLNNIQIGNNNINSYIDNNYLNNNDTDLKELNNKPKKILYGINKYFSFIDNNNKSSNNDINIRNISSIFKDKDSNHNTETDKVFTLDHFNNNFINKTNEDNIAKINFEYSTRNTHMNININSNLSERKKSTEINNSINAINMTTTININNDKKIKENNNDNNKENDDNNNPTFINLNSKEKNLYKIPPKKKYYDVRITNFINISEPNNMKLNRELLVNVLEFVDLRNLINKVPQVCRFWRDLSNKTISSANYNTKIDFRDNFKINEKEIKILFKKGKNLKHIQILRDIISEDFGGIKGVGNFLKKIELIMQLSDPKDIHYKGVMLSSFKIKPRRGFEMNNFISNKSINLICENSKFSLKTLILRNCTKLSNRVFDGISSCVFLNTLEISFNE